jgi:hypothetical protein
MLIIAAVALLIGVLGISLFVKEWIKEIKNNNNDMNVTQRSGSEEGIIYNNCAKIAKVGEKKIIHIA